MTPKDRKLQEGDPHWLKPRGAEQRNEALRWLREKADADKINELIFENAVVYFADDDNTYSLQLFEEVSVQDFSLFVNNRREIYLGKQFHFIWVTYYSDLSIILLLIIHWLFI